MSELTELERDVLRAALDAYTVDQEERAEDASGVLGGMPGIHARRAAIARDLIERF